MEVSAEELCTARVMFVLAGVENYLNSLAGRGEFRAVLMNDTRFANGEEQFNCVGLHCLG